MERYLVTMTVDYGGNELSSHSAVVKAQELLGYIAFLTCGDARLKHLSVVPAP